MRGQELLSSCLSESASKDMVLIDVVLEQTKDEHFSNRIVLNCVSAIRRIQKELTIIQTTLTIPDMINDVVHLKCI